MDIELRIKDGQIRFIYNDGLVGLLAQGDATTNRASHVEPRGNKWIADMGPVNGPILGPFDLRSDALNAEVAWLYEHKIPIPK